MKTEGFVKLLRKVIREEVSKTIRTELKVLLNEVKNDKHDINLQELTDVPKRSKKPVAKKQFTKNPVLNDLLNETSGHKSDNPWPTMDFRSEMAASYGGQQNVPLATHDVNGAPVNMSNENVAKTVDLMTKDYSQLMKAIDKKKGIR